MLDFLERLEPIWRPHAGQSEFLLADSPIKVLACGRRWGKTDACAVQILASMHVPEPSRHLILAPTADQAKILFDRVVLLLGAIGQRAETRRSPYPTLKWNGHRVAARSGHIGRLLRGNEANHIVVDEAAFVPEELVSEVAMPMLATTNGSLTLISTPHGLNHFYRFFQMGQRGEHGIWSRAGPSSESPHVSRNFLAIQRQLISDRAYQIEYEARFIESVGTVFRPDAVAACVVPVAERIPDAPVAIGIDWGRYSDATAVAVVCGTLHRATVLHVETIECTGWAAQVERIGRILARYPSASVQTDATGAGDVAITLLRDRFPGRKVTGLVFTRALKWDLIDRLSSLVEYGQIKFEPDPRLLRELEHFVAGPDGKLEARGGYHDDVVVALSLAVSLLQREGSGAILTGRPRAFAEP